MFGNVIKLAFVIYVLCFKVIAQHNELQIYGAKSGSGPSSAIAASANTMPDNTLYMPDVLPDTRLPLVLWANGGCADNGLHYAIFLREIASHGYLVIAAGKPIKEEPDLKTSRLAALTNPAALGNNEVPSFGGPDAATTSQLLNAIAWAESQNKTADSIFYNKINLNKIAAMGHSCGGLQAIEIATDPRIGALIVFNSGVLDKPFPEKKSSLSMTKDILNKLHSPIAYINGGPEDVAYFNAVDDFNKINQVPLFFAENGVGHAGTFHFSNGGSYAKVALSWLNWHLKDDKNAQKWFVGEHCVICQSMDWQVMRKNFH